VLGVTIDVSALDPVLTATATGLPGGAAAHYSAPIVRVNGNVVVGQNDISALIAQLNPALAPLLTGLAPLLKVELNVPSEADVEGSATLDGQGTHASVDSVVAHLVVHLLPALGGEGVLLADLAIAPMHAEASAPAGGIDCGHENPIVVTKDVSTNTVHPGDSFDYTITVKNTDAACTLSAVKVTDVITGPAGSSVTDTDPKADTIDGLTVTWNNIGDIGPGESKVLHLTLKTSADAAAGGVYHDEATANGTCDGVPFEGTGTLDGPTITSGPLARTGGNDGIAVVGGILIALSLGVRGLRRRAVAT
jgi:uncharacterized repeat protein (TIGR01451 family)